MTTPKLITTCAVMHSAGPSPDDDGRVCVGHCPACHQAVFTTDDPVWTCPADLSEGNPHREDTPDGITEQLRESAGVFSNCPDDFGNLGPCPFDHMPLHGRCYGSDAITY